MTSNDLQLAARSALRAFNLSDARLTTFNRERNAVFRVDSADGRRFVLRLRSNDRFDDSAARVQMKWLERLSQQTNIGAPVPNRTRSGRWFTNVTLDKSRWRATCLSWVTGRSPKGPSFLRPPILRAIGATTAQLHENAEKFRPAALKDCPQLNAKFYFGPGTAAGHAGRGYLSADEHDIVRRAADRIRRAMRRTADSRRHVGIIHGDLEPPNWAITAGVPRPIDFDEFGVGHFAFDLMQILWTHALWKDYPRYRRDLLAGYESLRPISDQDRSELDLYQAIAFIQWLNRGSSQGNDEDFRKWVVPTVRRIGELCCIK